MILRGFFISILTLGLSACAVVPPQLSLPPPTSVAASQTNLDERALLGVELSYKAARTLIGEAANAGFVDAQLARKLAKLDNQLFSALKRARSAYALANAASYRVALAEAAPLITEIWALVAGNRKASNAA